MNKKYLLLFLMIILYLANGISSLNVISITSDEGSHLSYGIRILKGNPERVNPEQDNSKMPISALNAIPRGMEQVFSKNLKKSDYGERDTINGRYMTLLFSVMTILLVFVWSKQLYGINAGLFSTFLMVLCPNNIANAVLVTTDSYSVFFLLATMYFLWRYANSNSIRDFIYFALLLSLSQLAKQSLIHLYFLAPLCLLLYAVVMHEKLHPVKLLKHLLIIITVSWVIINAGYLFYHLFIPFGNYQFSSQFFLQVQNNLPANIPVPFSQAFVKGLDLAKHYDELGGGFAASSMGNVTIMGHSSTGGSFWYYYFVSLFFKTPVTYLILLAWAIIILIKKENFNRFIKKEFFLTAPIIYYLIVFSFFYKSQAGIRHIIFIYPLIFIFCGILIKYIDGKKDFLILLLLSLFLLISVAPYFNNYYPYTNQFIGHKKNAWQYVGSCNLNMGQARHFLEDYLQHHPEIKMAPEQPQTGKFVLITDQYLDVWNTGKYAWLRKLKPAGELFYSYLWFDVKPEDIVP